MYSDFEQPIIKCSIFYYDTEYNKHTAERVLDILEKYNFFPPEKFYAEGLTKNRFIRTSEQTKEVMIQAYNEKDVFGVDMSSGDSRKVIDYWRVEWNFTFHKSKKTIDSTFKPWNILSIHSTHGRFNDPLMYEVYFDCIKELIKFLDPFYASVDDVDNKVKLMDLTGETHFVPKRIQQIYWGNYFGAIHCESFGYDKVCNIPAKNVEKIGAGVFFTLTDHVLEYDSIKCKRERNRIKNYLMYKQLVCD